MRTGLVLVVLLVVAAGCGEDGRHVGPASTKPGPTSGGAGESGTVPATVAELRFTVDGMFCGSCAKLIASTIREVPGVVTAEVDYDTKSAVIGVGEGVTVDAILSVVPDPYVLKPEIP